MAVAATSFTLALRAVGCPEFTVDVDSTDTIGDLKLAACAGCDIDPASMRIVFKGKVLRDEIVLQDSGIDGKTALHIARGQPVTPVTPSASSASEQTSSAQASALAAPDAPQGSGSADGLQLIIKGPGSFEGRLQEICINEPIAHLRRKVEKLCGLPVGQATLLHKARILKDDGPTATVSGCGLKNEDVLRVARRAPQQQSGAQPATASAAPMEPIASGPMPNPFAGGAAQNPEMMRLVQDMLGRGAAEEQIAAALNMMGGGGEGQQMQRPRRNQAGLVRDEAQERLDREVRLMARTVRYLVRERLRGGEQAEALAFQRGLIQGEHAEQQQLQEEEDEEEVDPEMMDDIARLMAESRSRGAPLPNAARFVDRALARAQGARALQERLRRDAGDMDPDLEDAVAAAEQSIAATNRASDATVVPQRLGNGTGYNPRQGPPPQ